MGNTNKAHRSQPVPQEGHTQPTKGKEKGTHTTKKVKKNTHTRQKDGNRINANRIGREGPKCGEGMYKGRIKGTKCCTGGVVRGECTGWATTSCRHMGGNGIMVKQEPKCQQKEVCKKGKRAGGVVGVGICAGTRQMGRCAWWGMGNNNGQNVRHSLTVRVRLQWAHRKEWGMVGGGRGIMGTWSHTRFVRRINGVGVVGRLFNKIMNNK